MNGFNYLNVSDDIKEYLPIVFSENCKPEISKIPTNKSSHYFSKICPYIPSTTDKFLDVKSLDISAKEITASVTEIAKLKSNENRQKIGSVITTIALAILFAGIVATCVIIPPLLYATASIVTCIFLTITFESVGIGILIPTFAGLCLSGAWTLEAFNNVSKAQNQLLSQANEAKINHEKLKEYFTKNYKILKQEIMHSIERKNQDLNVMICTKEKDCLDLMEKIKEDVANLKQVFVQLKDLHKFYSLSNQA